MFTCEMKIGLTIDTILYSDSFEENSELFNKGIDILKNHDCNNEFNDDDRNILEEIFIIIDLEENGGELI